ncbi:hypothetical protein POM88_049321 [Heracleum sosnowskyi]|uniref:Uncharacterized protein n=1 Tax=Heracleum sosnowskyi TaxID=360622 RepID=A0AAD8GY04_9APIA|nr:hypothetical protein POM88_049321 [Heracleum sosnowskyi]
MALLSSDRLGDVLTNAFYFFQIYVVSITIHIVDEVGTVKWDPGQSFVVDSLVNTCLADVKVLKAERDSAQDFQPLPFNYVEFARLLFDHAHASSILVLGIFIVPYKLNSPEMIQDAERRLDARSQAADHGPRTSMKRFDKIM